MGDARTLWYPEVYQNYRSNVVDALDTDQELFLITSNGTTHHDEDLSSLTTPKSRYNEAISYLNFTAVIWMDEMKKVKLVDEQFCPQYNRWPLCVELVERREREISDGFQFTHILRSRPDLVMLKKLPPYDDLPDDEIGLPPYWECAGEVPVDRKDAGLRWQIQANCGGIHSAVSDLFAVIPRKYLRPYLEVNWEQNLPMVQSCGGQYVLCECRIKATLDKHNIP